MSLTFCPKGQAKFMFGKMSLQYDVTQRFCRGRRLSKIDREFRLIMGRNMDDMDRVARRHWLVESFSQQKAMCEPCGDCDYCRHGVGSDCEHVAPRPDGGV